VNQVIIRVLAVLIALGLCASSVDARTLATPAATSALSISVDPSDDLAELELVTFVVTLLDETRVAASLVTRDSPPRYEHCWFVFRPPRASAFS
jgi:hypothetical protein